MVYYRQMMIINPRAPASDLISFLKRCVNTAWQNGGVLKKVENNGIQPLAYKFKDKNTESGIVTWHSNARILWAHYELSPKAMKEIEHLLKNYPKCLRYTTLKAKDDPVRRAINVHATRPWQPFLPAHYEKLMSSKEWLDRESYVPWVVTKDEDHIYDIETQLYEKFMGESRDSEEVVQAKQLSKKQIFQKKMMLDFLSAKPNAKLDPTKLSSFEEDNEYLPKLSDEQWGELRDWVFGTKIAKPTDFPKTDDPEEIQKQRRTLLSLANTVLLFSPTFNEQTPMESYSNINAMLDFQDPKLGERAGFFKAAVKAIVEKQLSKAEVATEAEEGDEDEESVYSVTEYIGAADTQEDSFADVIEDVASSQAAMEELQEKKTLKEKLKKDTFLQFMEPTLLEEKETLAGQYPPYLQRIYNCFDFEDTIGEDENTLNYLPQVSQQILPKDKTIAEKKATTLEKIREDFRRNRVETILKRGKPEHYPWLQEEFEKYAPQLKN